MFDFFNRKKTNFQGGGLILNKARPLKSEKIYAPDKSISPRKRDNRDLCILTSDQSDTPKCAAYSTAGFIEVKNWKKNHYPEQVDPFPIYKEAKKLDENNDRGTTLDNAVQAAINLELISGQIKYVDGFFGDMNNVGKVYDIKNDIKFCIHQYDVLIGGFSITNEWNYVNTKTGRIPKFDELNVSLLGGHGVLICGYDEEGIYIQNSWGQDWGLYGFALLSWEQVDIQFSYGMLVI